ncbi:uncharacterized protein P884DRAFT_256067 [Thermothelomyces heterothallicus CBS 202.75]|uniref:uncharacterized protein n=1 Tax=Thermothelomyces heterothallicus CBS 202.75 TaxID=1149848 RepID=UPI0037436B8C
MDCSCRTAALRIFVRSLAQIQVPLRNTTPRAGRYQSLSNHPSRVYTARTNSVFTTASQALHTSCARSSAPGAPQVVEGDGGASKHGGAGLQQQPTADSCTTSEQKEASPGATSSGPRNIEYQGMPTENTKKGKRQSSKPETSEEQSGRAKPKREKEPWMIQKEALKKKFPEGWNPRKRLSPDALVGIRMLHKQFPEEYTTEVLAQKFEVSPEAIRRILKSKWEPDPETERKRQERWFRRGKRVWTQWAALGKKPPRKWRAEGIVRDPIWNRPRGPNHKDKAARAEAQRRLAKAMMG